MMKKTALFWLYFQGFCLPAYAQLENKGWWTRDLFTFEYYRTPGDAGKTPERKYKRFATQPEIGYTLGKRWMVGIVGQYDYRSDKYHVPADTPAYVGSTKSFYGAGPLVRYYLPLGARVSLMPEFYMFYSHQVATEIYSDFGNLKKTRRPLDTYGMGLFPSLVCFLTRDLALSLTVASVNYYTSKDGTSLSININPQQWLLGVEYYFEK
ncbi:MAG: hypothetical protein EPGJADBJ_02243 [Saprospiraceae bacterium]|nr:hypothetical protein [Saprospiraceae bacterium]